MQIRCPSCHAPFDAAPHASWTELSCPTCGSVFGLAGADSTAIYEPGQDDDARDARPAERPRRVLGHFELAEQIGIGAFGSVYRARDTQLDRQVAVKIPRSHQLDAQQIELFLRDARAAAQLGHPNIVSVFEVGREDGTLYIVSDYVDGTSLKDLLASRRLPIAETVQLVIKIARAVHHAHLAGVVHRDLKPGNVMVDRAGEPHVIDFGLARRAATDVTLTVEGQVLGTPAYMSPEQARGEGHRVDGRCDVYSLGVILYELLAGEVPFRGNVRMLLHQVLHDEPRSLRSLNDRIPRDLETICLKAMAKEPTRRYATAEDFAADLRRWLSGEPIAARPVGRVEKTWRWARRNPVVAGLSAAVVLALALGSIVSASFAIEANRRATEAVAERIRADQKAAEAQARAGEAAAARSAATEEARRARVEAEKAREVSRFLAQMFEESAPLEIGGLRFESAERSQANANLTARQILERGAERVSRELQGQPIIQAELMDTVGNVYVGLGMIDKAEPLLERALGLREKHLPHEHLDVASSLHSLGLLRFGQLRAPESATALRDALAIRRKLLGDDHELMDSTRLALATVLGVTKPGWSERQDAVDALNLAKESLAWRRKHFGNTHIQTAVAMLAQAGTSLNFGGGGMEAEIAKLLIEATPILSNNPTTKPIAVAVTQFQQAVLLSRLGQRKGAVAAILRAMDAARGAASSSHPFAIELEVYAVNLLIDLGELNEAERICREAIERNKSLASSKEAMDLLWTGDLCEVLLGRFEKTRAASDLDEAEKLFQQYVRIMGKLDVFPDAELFQFMSRIAGPLARDTPERAEEIYRQTVELTKSALTRRRQQKSREPVRLDAFEQAVHEYGAFLRRSGRTEEASTLYRDCIPLARDNSDELYGAGPTRDPSEVEAEQGNSSATQQQ